MSGEELDTYLSMAQEWERELGAIGALLLPYYDAKKPPQTLSERLSDLLRRLDVQHICDGEFEDGEDRAGVRNQALEEAAKIADHEGSAMHHNYKRGCQAVAFRIRQLIGAGRLDAPAGRPDAEKLAEARWKTNTVESPDWNEVPGVVQHELIEQAQEHIDALEHLAPAGRLGELDEITLNEIVRDVAELPDSPSHHENKAMMGPTPLQYLELTPDQYSEFCNKRMVLSHLLPNGNIDRSEFMRWAIETYGLEIDEEYHIRVMTLAASQPTKENNGPWYCCSAEFGEHEPNCKNFTKE